MCPSTFSYCHFLFLHQEHHSHHDVCLVTIRTTRTHHLQLYLLCFSVMQSPHRIPPRTHRERRPLRSDRDVEVESHRVRNVQIFIKSLISNIFEYQHHGYTLVSITQCSNNSQTSSSPMITEVSDDTLLLLDLYLTAISDILTQDPKGAVRLHAVAMYGMIRLSTECVRNHECVDEISSERRGTTLGHADAASTSYNDCGGDLLLQLPQDSKKAEEKVFNIPSQMELFCGQNSKRWSRFW